MTSEERGYLASMLEQTDTHITELFKLEKSPYGHIATDFDKLAKRQRYYDTLLSQQLLYFAHIILANEDTLPIDARLFNEVYVPNYQREIGWKVELEYQKRLSKDVTRGTQGTRHGI